MKKTRLLSLSLIFTTLLFSCSDLEELEQNTTKTVVTKYNIQKPLQKGNNKSSRIVNGISYGFYQSGYQFSDVNNGFIMHMTAFVENNTNVPQNLTLFINAYDSPNSSCVIASSIDALPEGGSANLNNRYSITWQPNSNLPLEPGDYRTINFTLKIKDPYSCVEGSWAITYDGVPPNFTDDYVYLIQ